jgi:hypothetical protein
MTHERVADRLWLLPTKGSICLYESDYRLTGASYTAAIDIINHSDFIFLPANLTTPSPEASTKVLPKFVYSTTLTSLFWRCRRQVIGVIVVESKSRKFPATVWGGLSCLPLEAAIRRYVQQNARTNPRLFSGTVTCPPVRENNFLCFGSAGWWRPVNLSRQSRIKVVMYRLKGTVLYYVNLVKYVANTGRAGATASLYWGLHTRASEVRI